MLEVLKSTSVGSRFKESWYLPLEFSEEGAKSREDPDAPW